MRRKRFGLRRLLGGSGTGQEMSRTKQFHFMLKRVKPYNVAGRYQTETRAREIDEGMKHMLRKLDIALHEINADDEAATSIVTQIELD